MKPNDFIDTMQRWIGVNAVGPSALRGQGKGVLKVTQSYLGSINLSEIPYSNQQDYEHWLNNHTKALLGKLPIRNTPWGAARKALNLFMRGALYNQYIDKNYKIRRIENWLELPLDSVVAKALKQQAGRGKLPQWAGLKSLKAESSNEFQAFAAKIAKGNRMARVHLDIYMWLKNR